MISATRPWPLSRARSAPYCARATWWAAWVARSLRSICPTWTITRRRPLPNASAGQSIWLISPPTITDTRSPSALAARCLRGRHALPNCSALPISACIRPKNPGATAPPSSVSPKCHHPPCGTRHKKGRRQQHRPPIVARSDTPLGVELGHVFVAHLEVRIDVLHVIVFFQHGDQPHQRRALLDIDWRLGLRLPHGLDRFRLA